MAVGKIENSSSRNNPGVYFIEINVGILDMTNKRRDIYQLGNERRYERCDNKSAIIWHVENRHLFK